MPGEFFDSGDPINSVSYNPILSELSDQTQKYLMKSITMKCNKRGDDIKSSIASSDEKTVDSNILHCILVKLRRNWKHNKRCYNLDICSNLNHFAIEDTV